MRYNKEESLILYILIISLKKEADRMTAIDFFQKRSRGNEREPATANRREALPRRCKQEKSKRNACRTYELMQKNKKGCKQRNDC